MPGQCVLAIAAGGITALGGNAWDGEFRGLLPTGDGLPEGDVVARFDVTGHRAPLPRPVGGGLVALGSTAGAVVPDGPFDAMRRQSARRRG